MLENKITTLKTILKSCQTNSKLYKRKYKKMKKIDDIIDLVTALLSGGSIALIIVGFTNPACLIASAILSGVNFVIVRLQDKYNLKHKYIQHNLSMQQYNDLMREISAVLTKNNLTSDEYQSYIEECYSKISLIEDTQLF